jgi:hypothetical protein
VVNGDAPLGQQFFNVPVERAVPWRRYQRTTTEITSGGDLKPAKAEAT